MDRGERGERVEDKGEQAMLKVIHPNAGGIDIGAEEVYVCVPEDRDEKPIQRFGTTTPDLHEMARWLVACKVDSVALESTGVYWIPVYMILSEYKIEVQVVNAQHVKNVPGRKSDVKDSQWLQELHSVGLLRGSFRPSDDILVLRSYLRHRDSLIEHRAAHVNHMQKAMIQMNVRLTEVLTDVTGMTGMGIMRAIAQGERDPSKLLAFRNHRCKHSPEDFVKALTANYRAEHLFSLKQSLALYDAYSDQIILCEAEIEKHFAVIKPSHDSDDLPPLEESRKRNTHSKNAPHYDAREQMYRITGVDLTDIDGLHESTAQTILAEIGTDMSKWKSVKHFSSWLGLAPKNDITGGKVKRSRTLFGNRRANQAFRMAAQAVSKSKSALGAFYRRTRARIDSEQAIVATAHKIARIVYHMLKHRQPFFAVSAAQYDAIQHDRERKSIERRAAKLGLKLVAA
jgi:transposase